MIGTEAISRVIGKDVYDQSGDKIGSASEVYLDDESGQPEWVTVRTGLFGTKESFVPLRDADLTDDGVRVPVSKAQVKDAPKIDTDGHLSPQEEQELYRYYGLGSGQGTTTDTTVGRVDRDETTGTAGTAGMVGTTGTAGTAGTMGTTETAGVAGTAGTAGLAGTDRDRDGRPDHTGEPGVVGRDVS
ncbi:PRC-barrel domain-containing protein, partial [Geodermatophilus siccatus]